MKILKHCVAEDLLKRSTYSFSDEIILLSNIGQKGDAFESDSSSCLIIFLLFLTINEVRTRRTNDFLFFGAFRLAKIHLTSYYYQNS